VKATLLSIAAGVISCGRKTCLNLFFFYTREGETDLPIQTNGMMIATATEVVTTEVDTRIMVEETIRTITMIVTIIPTRATGTLSKERQMEIGEEVGEKPTLGGGKAEVVEDGEVVEVTAVTLVGGSKVVEGIADKVVEGIAGEIMEVLLLLMQLQILLRM